MTDNREIVATAQLSIEEFNDGSWRVKTDYDPPVNDFKSDPEAPTIDWEDYPASYLFMGKMVSDVIIPTVASMSEGGDDLLSEETTAPGSAAIN